MDWKASGIQHRWRFQLVDSVSLQPRGWLTGVTKGKITESYRGELRSQLSLSLDGSTVPLGTAVRVWHDATYNGETVSELLGTFHAEPMGGKGEYGRFTGDVTLNSTLTKLKSTLGSQIRTIKKSTNVISHFKQIVPWAGATPWVASSWQTSKTFADDYVWQMTSVSIYSEAQRCADAIGGYLGVDAEGRVTLVPYKQPSTLPETFWLVPGGIVHIGVDVDVPEIVNRVTAKYEKNGHTYTSEAKADASHPWSYQNVGRWYAEELTGVTIQDGANIQNQLDKATEQALIERTSRKNEYSVGANYDPSVQVGRAGHFTYNDGGSTLIDTKVFCSGREINIDHTAEMSLTLEQL